MAMVFQGQYTELEKFKGKNNSGTLLYQWCNEFTYNKITGAINDIGQTYMSSSVGVLNVVSGAV